MLLRRLGLCGVIALATASCTTLKPVDAGTTDLARAARGVMGTSLIGARGATPTDQDKIDDTVAGGCAVGVYTRSECARHKS